MAEDIEAQKADGNFEFLSLAASGQEITVRDDQYEFDWILDAVRLSRQKRRRFRLIDTGVLDCPQMEWIAKAGADIYTSDEIRKDAQELLIIHNACKRGKGIMAYFYYGALGHEQHEKEGDKLTQLQDLGRNGIYIHMTNKDTERDFSQLIQLAKSCRKGGSWLVYYHHGALSSSLMLLKKSGAWVHISSQILKDEESRTLISEFIHSERSVGSNLILHVKEGLDLSILREIMQAGAFVIFPPSRIGYESPYKDLEKKAARRRLDFRTYYLYPEFPS